ncbi:MAG TPA: ribonuclease P protein component [Mycobacteriales bacterium]|nr:ribonuclease P protein component [Mycobacteriales bacterium]
MLPSNARLRHRDDFTAVLRHGRRTTSPPLVIHVLPPNSPTDRSVGTRVGFVISAKVAGAAQRNRLRRRLRHICVDLLGELPPGTRLVVRALPGAAELGFAELAGIVRRCSRRVATG